ncbi:MAG: Na/Pi cotransporter family protein, partial [Deltaproteobacteria bacterium]|nr:Na/Pi cotransporter family protein [Deltaproteobacteria bacterium]
LISTLTRNRLQAVITGILVTLILQSSTATIVMLVGFASSGAITLSQAMGVILGADIGTTLVVILLSVKKIADYSLLLLIVGVVVDIFAERKRTRYVSMVLLGFGFVFFGMQLMVHVTSPLKESHLLAEIFSLLRDNPFYAFVASAIITSLVQNSATTLGLTIALAFSGLIGITEAIPLVLGANVGTCASSFLASINKGAMARQVAVSHLFFKLTGALIVMIFLEPVATFTESFLSHYPSLQPQVALQVALIHVGFNLLLSLFFLPFITQGAWAMKKVVPDPPESEGKPFGQKYLDPKALETPALAFANAKLALIRMAEIAGDMFRQTIAVFERDDNDLMAFIEDQDDRVDILDREVKFYLAKISQEHLTPEQARMQLNLVAITSDLEEICDVINKNILELAAKKINKGRHFSAEGWKEIVDVHDKVAENFQLMLSTLTSEDEILARKINRHEKHLAQVEDHYREAHLQRLHKGMREAIETSSIHLDLLSNFRRINSKLTAIVKAAHPDHDPHD